jgi:hypothetical protein
VISTAYTYIGANGLATLIGLGPKLDPTVLCECALCQSGDDLSGRRVR